MLAIVAEILAGLVEPRVFGRFATRPWGRDLILVTAACCFVATGWIMVDALT